MPKQRYILILLLLCGIGLSAEVQIQSGFYSVSGYDKTIYHNQSRLDARFNLVPDMQLTINSKLDAADRELGEFPQKKWMHNFVGLEYNRKHWSIETGYRNLLFANPERLQLYPSWNLNMEFDRQTQHQTQLVVAGNLMGLSLSAYGINKQLRSNPTEYIWDNNTFEMVPTAMPARSLIDEYYGMDLVYQATPYLSINASTDIKQDSYTETGLYDLNTFAMGTKVELKPIPNGRFTGTFNWQNQDGDNIPDITRNIYQTTLRYQQSLGLQLNGFISLINNGCSDDKLSEVYLLSNQVRCHLQYHFPYDSAQASYLSAGVKQSLEKEKTAFFSEGQVLLLNHLYGNLSYRHIGDAVNYYQAKLSYFISPFSECYFQYIINDSDLYSKPINYLGIGTSIQL
jgi:hypothetical protein